MAVGPCDRRLETVGRGSIAYLAIGPEGDEAEEGVAAVYTAFLAGKAQENLNAELGVGFYYFTAYCLTSLLAIQFMKLETEPSTAAEDGSSIRTIPTS